MVRLPFTVLAIHNHRRGFLFCGKQMKKPQLENGYLKLANELAEAFSRINLSKYELLLIGTALYWAEGYRKQDKNRSPYISFVNSDPGMAKLFLRFVCEIIKVSEARLYVTVRIYQNTNKEDTIRFWSQITDIPKDRFHVTRQISQASKRKRSCNSLPYGTLKLDVWGRQNFFRIKGWIDGLIKQSKIN